MVNLTADKSVINIACAADEGYVPHTATMLCSLFANNNAESFHIHFLHEALSDDCRNKLIELVGQYGQSITFWEMREKDISAFPCERFHRSCWYRVILPELLPDLDRVLYLDSDMVVVNEIVSLWRKPLEGALFAAVSNPMYPFMPDRARKLELESKEGYLNSGVLLMNLEAMRECNVAEDVKAYANKNPENPWPEQDALSVVCKGKWLSLHPKWNAQTTIFDLADCDLPFDKAVLQEARKNPAIVHFIGPLKPWSYRCRHSYQSVYHKFRAQTPWPEYQLEDTGLWSAAVRWLPYVTQWKVDRMVLRVRKFWLEKRLRAGE